MLVAAVKIVIAYTAVVGGPLTQSYCATFAASWRLHSPWGVSREESMGENLNGNVKVGCGCGYTTECHRAQLVVVCNGGAPDIETASLFLGLNPIFYQRVNDKGWDISGYMAVAKNFECDLLVCCGESVFFHRGDWLARLVRAHQKYGPGMYGVFSSNNLRPHLNTTMFAVSPRLLLALPVPLSRQERHEFEHGPNAFWLRLKAIGVPVRLVTFDGEYEPQHWREPGNILWKGDQSNCLAFCIHTERYAGASPETRELWESNADRGMVTA